MQKLLVSNSDKFEGQAVLVYNGKGTLCIIDVSETNMDAETIRHFKNATPVSMHMLKDAFKSPTVIVSAEFVITFEIFYQSYPLKRNRYKVEKAWAKLNETEQATAYHSLSAYKKYLSNNSNWLKPMIGDRYLKDREFETEWQKIKS